LFVTRSGTSFEFRPAVIKISKKKKHEIDFFPVISNDTLDAVFTSERILTQRTKRSRIPETYHKKRESGAKKKQRNEKIRKTFSQLRKTRGGGGRTVAS